MKRGFIALALSVLLGGAAAAADAPIFDWSGFYIGGSVGASWWKDQYHFVGTSIPTWEHDPTKGIFSGIIGIQKQFGNSVLGIEGSVGSTFGKSLGTDSCQPSISCSDLMTGKLAGPIWSVGPRLGTVFGPWMLYATGGYAAARIENDFGSVVPGKANHDGWYLGGGIDWMIARNWMLGLEYRHYDFGRENVIPTGLGGVPRPINEWTQDPSFDAVSLRLTYKFDGL